jgi:hypothetical protein
VKIAIKSQQDWWAGLMFIAIGLFFIVVALGTPEFIDRLVGTRLIPGYQMGSSVRMGPAYFPVVLGGLLAFLGLLVLFDALVEVKPLGLALASIALVFISAYGGHEFKWKEVATMSVVLVIFSVLVFVKALALPFPICPSFIDVCPIR